MKKLFFTLMSVAVAATAFAVVTPADPTNVSWNDYGDESGYSRLNFTLPQLDTDGNILNTENLGYRVYLDNDQIFTFERSVYTYDNIYGDVTDIWNWQYSGGTDFRPDYIYFYRTNADGFTPFFTWRIGLQAIFMNDNNEITYSNIVYDEVFPQTVVPKPAMPEISEFIDYGFMINLGYEIAADFDGNLVGDDYTLDKYFNGEEYSILDPEKVSFSVYTDNDQIFTFTPESFPGEIEVPMTQVPYTLRTPGGDIGYWDLHLNDVTTMGDNPFFTWRIGLQTIYTDGGQTTYSDIMYREIYPQLQEAKNVTSTSFVADWSCDDPNTYTINNFLEDNTPDVGYNLYVVNVETQETIVVNKVNPTNWTQDEWGYAVPLAGATYTVEGLTPGATYQFYVVVKQNTGVTFQSVVREVTLPGAGLRGDVNMDNNVSIADATALIDYLLSGDATGISLANADCNLDENVSIADVTALIDYLLSGAW